MPSRQRNALAILSAMILLTSCATQTTGTPVKAMPCVTLAPISFSALSDSAETIAQVRRFNAEYRAVCT